jgi:hypothetical protein
MLYQRDTGFIDVLIEPQYQDFRFGSRLCSVRSSDLTTLMAMKNSVRGEIDFNPDDPLYRFTGFAYLDDLARELKTMSVHQHVEEAAANFSRPASAFMYLGFEEPDQWGSDGDTWQGDLLPDEVHDFQFSVDASFDYFRVWPLFHLPADLKEETRP